MEIFHVPYHYLTLGLAIGLKEKKCLTIFVGCQTSIAQTSQGTQCTLREDLIITSTPVHSDDDLSDYEDEMEHDDPSYVPDPEEIAAEDEDDDLGFDDYDDRLYE